MAKCQMCQRRCKSPARLLVPVTFVASYQSGQQVTLPVGALLCRDETRRLSTVIGQSTSEGQRITYQMGAYRRQDGRAILE